MATNTISMVPRCEHGWRMGLGNMLKKENFAWWHTRRWWIQCLVWLLLMNGLFVEMNILGDQPVQNAGINFFMMGGVALSIGAIIMIQDAILGEQHSGTAAWVLSKPIRRPAFILAKLAAYAIGYLVLGIVIPGAVLYLQLLLHDMSGLSPIGFIGALGLTYLNMFFYMALTLMLATLFDGRGAVLGIPIGLLMAGLLINIVPITKVLEKLVSVMPWRMTFPVGADNPLVVFIAMGEPLPTVIPIIATVLWSLVFVGVALWRFQKKEF